jgi:ferrous iron transport protein B
VKSLVTCAAGCATCEERPVELRRGPLRAGPLTVALIGQPNCGKSTLFNAVAGYRSATGNFSGTTVRLAWSQVRVNGSLVELVDVPGIYSLTTSSPTEGAAKQFLLGADVDVIVNVVDEALLSRSLELTLELRELGIPMVVCLNMADEAQHKGITVSTQRLSEMLGMPVVETIAYQGVGVRELFARVLAAAGRGPAEVDALEWHRDVESVVERMEHHLANGNGAALPRRFLAVKLLEGDEELLAQVKPASRAAAHALRHELQQSHGRPAESVVMSERHDRAMHLFEQAADVGRPRKDVRAVIDNLLMHPVLGYVFLVVMLVGFFWAVFGFGGWMERTMLVALDGAFARIAAGLTRDALTFAVVKSLWDGFAGGAGIVLPYLVPFLIGLALLEDVGYLPRVAYLLDGLLHRIGLHGTSVVPIILGYGCSVPACLATRILPCPRDRFLATVLATLVPCSARSTVIFAMVAFYLGPGWALGIYAFNIVVVFASGWLLTRIWPEVSAGMILEVPRYQWPSAKVIARKVWLRLREFVVVSWPLLVAGSVVLGLAEYLHWDRYVNAMLSPLTALLGLPAAVGTTLIFGVLRKELSMVMLVQAVGTTQINTVMTAAQILVYTIFILFYIPCLATLVAMTKEIGGRLTLKASAYALLLAMVLGVAARFMLSGLFG